MDKNTIIGFILIAVILFGYTWSSQPSKEQLAERARQDSIALVQENKAKALEKKQAAQQQAAIANAQEDTTALFHSALNGVAEGITLSNSKVALTFNSKGAIVEKAVIKNYRSNEKQIKDKSKTAKDEVTYITLFDGADQSLNYTLIAKDANIQTKNLYFTPTNVSDTTVTFTADAGAGKTITISYVLGKGYMLHMKMQTTGMEGLFAPSTNTMEINWQDKARQQEKGYTFENRYATLTYKKVNGDVDNLSESSETKEEIEERLDWVAYKNQFFSAVMIAKSDFNEKASLTSIPQAKGSGYLKQYEAVMKSFFDPTGKTPTEFDFYYGPNDFHLLKAVENESSFGKELEMQKLVNLGWPLFRYINRWFTIYVFDFLTSMKIPMGVVLILITLLLKVITYPMVKKSYMSSAKMRVLKPKLDEATKQYNGPDQQMQKQQAMMQEYAKYGVSPMAGCLPALIQMPIWIAMFNFVPNAIELRGESFLWINDLSTYDPIVEWGTNIWLIGDHLSLTCILFCVGQLAYTWMTMKQQQDQMIGQQAEQMKMMQWMMMLMPLMFFFMFNDYSAGLNFYYFVSLFMSAVVMWALRRFTNEEKLLAKLEARYKENKNSGKKLTGLAGRLQAMQEQQQQLEAQRRELERKRRNMNERLK